MFFFQAEDGIRYLVRSRGLGDVYKRQQLDVRPGADPSRKATVVAEPLERGFGLTLGNALRLSLIHI